MQVVHGTWIPDDAGEFVQRGGFYVWVETDTPLGATRRRADSGHPRHLTQTALATFLVEKLGVRESAPGALSRRPSFSIKNVARAVWVKWRGWPTSARRRGVPSGVSVSTQT